MRLMDVNRQPTERQLRQFGAICLVALPLAGWLWGAGGGWIFGLAGLGLVLALVGVVAPRRLKPLFVGLAWVTAPLGFLIGELAMLLIFFGVLLPIGLGFRLLRHDALQRKIRRRASTYWGAKQPPRSVANYYRQS